jgi:NAD(P)-dependent dehydrogenase (short-subunit alcohol dehydrogenase family)
MRAEFADRVAIVTGAGSGIDAAVAIHLASEGARVAVADIDGLGAGRTVHLTREAGGHAEAVAVDVSDPTSVESAVTKTVASFGALHLAVNNAGVTGAAASTGEYDPQDWRRVIDVDLSGVFYCLRYEIPALLTAGGASIVNIILRAGNQWMPTTGRVRRGQTWHRRPDEVRGAGVRQPAHPDQRGRPRLHRDPAHQRARHSTHPPVANPSTPDRSARPPR